MASLNNPGKVEDNLKDLQAEWDQDDDENKFYRDKSSTVSFYSVFFSGFTINLFNIICFNKFT